MSDMLNAIEYNAELMLSYVRTKMQFTCPTYRLLVFIPINSAMMSSPLLILTWSGASDCSGCGPSSFAQPLFDAKSAHSYAEFTEATTSALLFVS